MVWWLEQKSVDLFPEWPVTHCTTVKVPNFALLLPAAEDQARHHAEKGHSSAATDGLHKAQSHSFAVAAWVLLQELGDTAVQFCYSTACRAHQVLRVVTSACGATAPSACGHPCLPSWLLMPVMVVSLGAL